MKFCSLAEIYSKILNFRGLEKEGSQVIENKLNQRQVKYFVGAQPQRLKSSS